MLDRIVADRAQFPLWRTWAEGQGAAEWSYSPVPAQVMVPWQVPALQRRPGPARQLRGASAKTISAFSCRVLAGSFQRAWWRAITSAPHRPRARIAADLNLVMSAGDRHCPIEPRPACSSRIAGPAAISRRGDQSWPTDIPEPHPAREASRRPSSSVSAACPVQRSPRPSHLEQEGLARTACCLKCVQLGKGGDWFGRFPSPRIRATAIRRTNTWQKASVHGSALTSVLARGDPR